MLELFPKTQGQLHPLYVIGGCPVMHAISVFHGTYFLPPPFPLVLDLSFPSLTGQVTHPSFLIIFPPAQKISCIGIRLAASGAKRQDAERVEARAAYSQVGAAYRRGR